eukprot:36842_1
MSPLLFQAIVEHYIFNYNTKQQERVTYEQFKLLDLRGDIPEELPSRPSIWQTATENPVFHTYLEKIPTVISDSNKNSKLFARVAVESQNVFNAYTTAQKKLTAKRYFGNDKTLFFLALEAVIEYPTEQYSVFADTSHTVYLNNILERNGLQLHREAVPAAGDCLFISSEREYHQDYHRNGEQLRNSVISLLHPNNQASAVYYRMYETAGGNREQYFADLRALITRSDTFWDSLLMDIVPFIISDVYLRPVLIWQSYPDALPVLLLGPEARGAVEIEFEPLSIARHAIENHYYNVQTTQRSSSSSPPKKKRKLNPSKSKYINSEKYMESNNAFIRNPYDNNTYLFILYLCVLFHPFKQLLNDRATNKMSRCIHYLMSKSTGRINKPSSKNKKKNRIKK